MIRCIPGKAQHAGARNSQQDSCGFGEPPNAAFAAHGGFAAVVCDGMGGMEHGDAASRTAVDAFLEAYARKTPEETVPAALERSAQEANAKVVDLARNLGRVGGIGTTLVAAVVRDTSLFYISVGDSGLFHLSRGRLNSINHPHVFSNLLDQAVARGSMSAEEAHSHPERESLTSYIGAEKIDEIDQNQEPWPLHAGETILLASDGMFKTLTLAEIQDTLQGDPQQWASALVERTLAKQREYQDNVTVLTVTLDTAAAEVGGDGLLPTAVMPVPSGLHPPTLAAPARALPVETGSNAIPTWDSPIPVLNPPAPAPAPSASAPSPSTPSAPVLSTSTLPVPSAPTLSGPGPSAPGPPPLPPTASRPPGTPPVRTGMPVWLILLVVLVLAAAVAVWWFGLLPGGE